MGMQAGAGRAVGRKVVRGGAAPESPEIRLLGTTEAQADNRSLLLERDPSMKTAALAPLGALGLGVLAVVLLVLDRDPSQPSPEALAGEASAPRTSSVDTAIAARPGTPPENEPHPRSGPILETIADPRDPPPPPPAELEKRAQPPRTTLRMLQKRPRWMPFLRAWIFLPKEEDPVKRLARLETALAGAANPVVRQNLIFLAALALDPAQCVPWLEALRASADPADAEDALVALAFLREPGAFGAFLDLARTPSGAKVHRLLDRPQQHEALAQSGTAEAREILRSYRAIETTDRAPYFDMMAYDATYFGRYGKGLGWVAGRPWSDTEVIALYRAFLSRYPGHPVSDDLARRIGRIHIRTGDVLEGTRWLSRSATLPDQDKAYDAATLMASYAEIVLTPEQVLHLSESEGLRTPNRSYFQYVWLRRLAAERSFETALGAWERLATREPDSELGVAWRRRFSAPPTKALESGVAALPADDPLREQVSARTPWPVARPPAEEGWTWARYGIRTGRSYGEDKWRLEPWPEVVVLDRARLVKQARLWTTIAELERRAERAKGQARADLLYKLAAVFYHERDVVFPAYGYHTMRFSGQLRSATWGWSESDAEVHTAAILRFEETSFSYLRAMRLFEQIEREHPGYAAMDKVLFSEGMTWRLLADYRPYYSWSPVLKTRWEGRQDPALQSLVLAFERCAQLFPDSPLSDDALAAAAYWRRTHKSVFAGD
jgi:hypothetical protein